MPLNALSLGNLIAANLKTEFNIPLTSTTGSNPSDAKAVAEANLDKFGKAIAEAVVAHVQANLSGITQAAGTGPHTHPINPGDLT